jgi:endonuclease YncB( thermonuclease family)
MSDDLSDITWEQTHVFIPRVTTGRVIKVYDGDTFTIATRLPGDETVYRFAVRLNGIDAPEIKTRNPNEKIAASASQQALSKLILNKIVTLSNVSFEKYGRLLADVSVPSDDTEITPNIILVNQWMLDHDFAISYDGGTKTVQQF